MEQDQISGLEGWFQGEAVPCPGDSSLLKISGTYCIYTMRFTPEQEAALGKIFNQLPALSSAPSDPPCFYGATEASPQHLAWSFEPSGIVVWGKLKPEQWREWDSTFRQLVELAALPRFEA